MVRAILMVLALGPEPADATVSTRAAAASPGPGGPLRRYLGRDVVHGPRFLDHGVLAVGAAGGVPHVYRVELALGLLDHLTIGATAHWVPGQRAPGWAPFGALALWRARRVEVGASYRQVLHPPPRADRFAPRSHYVLGAVTFGQAWWAAGFDLGIVHMRDAPVDPEADEADFVRRVRLGGGLHVRIGTRRIGLTLQGQLPVPTAEAVLDVRFDLFEVRPRGRWLDHG